MNPTLQHKTPRRSSTQHVRQVLDSIRRIVRVLRVASRNAEKHVGLSAAQLFVLQKLAESPSLSVNELAERTHTHQSSVSVVVQRLVDRGFVSRSRCEEDARQSQLRVTTSGRAALRSAPEATQDRLIAALDRMPVSQLTQLAKSLGHFVNLLDLDLATPVAMFFEEESETDKGSHDKAKRKSKGRR